MRCVRDLRRAFTLVELLVSMVVLSIIVAAIAGLSNSTAQIWSGGERTVENNQTGRAMLEIIARELSQAVVSSRLPFVQNPTMPTDANQRTSNGITADSIFWVAPLSSTNSGNLCEIGYYLTNTFELKRFFVPPSDAANYKVLTATPTDYTPRPTGSGGANGHDHASAALWVTDFITAKDSSNRLVSNTVASGVLNLFIRCLDINGDPIPWLDTSLKYNSAEPMCPATPGQRNTFAPNLSNPSSFAYTYYNAGSITDTQNTIPANLLPYAVEVTLVTVDLKTLRRLGASAVPAIPATTAQRASYPPGALPTAPLTIPGNIAQFVQSARVAGFKDVHSFSTIVRLHNASQ